MILFHRHLYVAGRDRGKGSDSPADEQGFERLQERDTSVLSP